MLVSGSGTLGRPIQVRELWEALAVAEARDFITAIHDPIKSNRIIIRSWTGFRRQLQRKCGPLLEVIPEDHKSNERDSEDSSEIGPQDIVQLIHRTVKDFLEDPERASSLHFPGHLAVTEVQHTALNYARVVFPNMPTFYAPKLPAVKGTQWKTSIEKLMRYLNTRVLVNYMFEILPEEKAALLGPYVRMFDDCVAPTIGEWSENEIRDSFREESAYYPWLTRSTSSYTQNTANAVMVGYAFQYSCAQGLIVAVRNLLHICRNTDQIRSNYSYPNVAANGALIAAIDNGLNQFVQLLMKDNRHQGRFMEPKFREFDLKDPFLQRAISSGNEDVTLDIFEQRRFFCLRYNQINSYTVTSKSLPLKETGQPAAIEPKVLRQHRSSKSSSNVNSWRSNTVGLKIWNRGRPASVPGPSQASGPSHVAGDEHSIEKTGDESPVCLSSSKAPGLKSEKSPDNHHLDEEDDPSSGAWEPTDLRAECLSQVRRHKKVASKERQQQRKDLPDIEDVKEAIELVFQTYVTTLE
jgi:hypothetical protein